VSFIGGPFEVQRLGARTHAGKGPGCRSAPGNDRDADLLDHQHLSAALKQADSPRQFGGRIVRAVHVVGQRVDHCNGETMAGDSGRPFECNRRDQRRQHDGQCISGDRRTTDADRRGATRVRIDRGEQFEDSAQMAPAARRRNGRPATRTEDMQRYAVTPQQEVFGNGPSGPHCRVEARCSAVDAFGRSEVGERIDEERHMTVLVRVGRRHVQFAAAQ
jgi:hypothetical protein